MIGNKDSISNLNAINYDNFNMFNSRGHKYFSPLQQIPKLFPENLDVYCPGCSAYLTPEGKHLVNSNTAPNVYKTFLGTPFVNPANNTFNNYVNTPYTFNPHQFNSHHVNHFLNRPMLLSNMAFTTPILARDSSELFL